MTIQQKNAIDKISRLIETLEKLNYHDNIIDNEYMKWNEKALRIFDNIFGKNSKQAYKYVEIQFECMNSYGDCTHIETFNHAKKAMKSLLEVFIEEIEEWDEHINAFNKDSLIEIDKTKIFIVHGHDNGLKQEVARFIEKLGLTPIILHEQPNAGKTIIEKIESFTDVGFGIVLYTECDQGAKKGEDLKARARQNVVFEHGFLIAKLGRENVSHLATPNIEMPNDISGTIYVDNNNWKQDIFKELKYAGYDIDANDMI